MSIADTKSIPVTAPSYGRLEEQVGNTPLLPLRGVTAGLSSRTTILAKAEWFNPSGSVKDRPALRIMHSAVESGALGGGRRLLDSTSGNMGIAYATFGASMGIPVTLCIPENASPERLTVLSALGAEVILTDGSEGSDGAIRTARALAAKDPNRYWYANQYDNAANWRAHYESTGPELLHQMHGAVTHFVAGLGTTGTLIGTGRYLRERQPAIQIVGVQPNAAFHGLEGLKHLPSAIAPAIYDPALPDRIIEVETEAAHVMVRRLAREEGLLVGISSGAAAAAAVRLAAELDSATIVAVFPDAGHRYLSDKALWEERRA